MKLAKQYVEKPWGRTDLPAIFDAPRDKRIGEILFTGAPDLPLLVKYIFTSEKLSVQVHPSDEQARVRGLASGKSECWFIVEAEPDATIGVGLRGSYSPEAMRAAALDGSIEHLLDWRAVRAGDFLFVPAGTVHAIGPGVKLIEVQQNADVTYRLFDYGRPRELHLDDALAVASVEPYPAQFARHVAADEDSTLVDGPHFTLVYTLRDALHERRRWVLPLEGAVRSGQDEAVAGECLLLAPREQLITDGARMLIAATVSQRVA
jgi:mannose-6-phosphate isomerase